MAIASGGVIGAGGISPVGGTGGARGTGGLTTGLTAVVVGGSARGGSTGVGVGGTRAVGTGGAGGAGGPVTIRPDASVPDVPGDGGGPGTGGRTSTGGAISIGGTMGSGGATGVDGSPGSGGSTAPATGPCDIYAAASPETPCVAAYSMVRVVLSTYSGPLYQLRRGGSWNKTSGMSGGTFQDIGIKDGYADSAAQAAFCGSSTCTVSILYDQSGRKNDLTAAPAGCYTGTASEPDSESSATKASLLVNGHKVYALYMSPHDGYRNNQTAGMPTGNAEQSIYEVVYGDHYGTGCCWEFGNASTDNCSMGGSGSMGALFFGPTYWSADNEPVFTVDLGAGPWIRDCGAGAPENPPCYPSVPSQYRLALGILKTSAGKVAVKFGNAQSGSLVTAYDGSLGPSTWRLQGGIILGIGSDNSNSSEGTFLEGAITSGWPSNATDEAVLKNVQAARYGQ